MEKDGKFSERYKDSSQMSTRRRAEGRERFLEHTRSHRCHDCDKIIKETSKSRSRVWKKVMWFTRKGKAEKPNCCHCEEVEFNNDFDRDLGTSSQTHSNSWSFTRSASKKFRISYRKRRCKSDNVKKSLHRFDENACNRARPDAHCSNRSRGASPTATGNFCDFGSNSRVSSSKTKHASLLTGIARELNPPAGLSLEGAQYQSSYQLSKSLSSASVSCTKLGAVSAHGVRRCKSFPGPFSNPPHFKRRNKSENSKANGISSPPLKQKCYGLRRTATFNGKLNTEFTITRLKKSMSTNTADFKKLEKESTSLGEIKDQDGSIIGIVHFYKSPKNSCIRRMSSLNHGTKSTSTFNNVYESCESTSQESTSNNNENGQTAPDKQDDVIHSPRPFSSSQDFHNFTQKDLLGHLSEPQNLEKTCDMGEKSVEQHGFNSLLFTSQSSPSQISQNSGVIGSVDEVYTESFLESGISSSPIINAHVPSSSPDSMMEGEGSNLTIDSPHYDSTIPCDISNITRDQNTCIAETGQLADNFIEDTLNDTDCKLNDLPECGRVDQSEIHNVNGDNRGKNSIANLHNDTPSDLHEPNDSLLSCALTDDFEVGLSAFDKDQASMIDQNNVLFSVDTWVAGGSKKENGNQIHGCQQSISNNMSLFERLDDVNLELAKSLEGTVSEGKTEQCLVQLETPNEPFAECNVVQNVATSIAIQDNLEGTGQDSWIPSVSEHVANKKINIDEECCPESSEKLTSIWDQITIHKELENESFPEFASNVVPNDRESGCMRNMVQALESSSTSDYASCSDEDLSNQSDVPISTWRTSVESELKDNELRPPVPGHVFKMRTELILGWFQQFNDEQKNIVMKKLLNQCELPQMHLLSVAMESNLHKICPPNCQDMLVWLPYPVTLKILMYLDPVSLCSCNQVNKAWNELTNNPLLWQQLARSTDYQLSETSCRKQHKKYVLPNGDIHWKKVLAERFLLQRNWLNGKYKLKTYEGHDQGIACVQFDDTRIVSGSSDKTIKLWDITNTTSELMLTLEGHSGTVRCLDLNGNRLVSGSTDRTIKVWDLSFASYWAGASCKVTMVGHLHTVRCLQADDKKLVSGSYDKTVKVWDLKTGQCQLTLRGHTAAVLCVQFDDQKIVSGSYDKKIKVWDLAEGACLMTLDGHQDAVTCLNLTHDGMKIITGSLDYSLKFWDLYTGKCYGTLDWITSEGHTAVVRCLQVDSWRIVSGGDDKTLKVWELATGQRLLTLRYHSDGVTCMQFNDFAIVSGSYDRTVKLWDFTPEHPYLESVT